jgi:hypothetical protein
MSLQDTIDIVKSQTDIQDEDYISNVLKECDNDVIKAIMTLSDIKDAPKRNVSTPSVFDEIRTIVNEKEQLFYKLRNT